MPKFVPFRFTLVLMLCALASALSWRQVAAQSDCWQSITLGQPDTTNHPQISIPVAIHDESGNGQCALDVEQIAVFEDGEPVEVTLMAEEAPRHLIIVIDSGRYTAPQLRRYPAEALQELLTAVVPFLRDVDRVIVLQGRHDPGTNNQPFIGTVLDEVGQERVATAIVDIDFTLEKSGIDITRSQPLRTIPLLETALENAKSINAAAIVLITAAIHAPELPSNRAERAVALMSEAANASGVSISVVQTIPSAYLHEHQALLENLAKSTGGQYAALQVDRSNQDSLTLALAPIWDGATQYTLQVESLASAAGDHMIALKRVEGSEIGSPVTYELVKPQEVQPSSVAPVEDVPNIPSSDQDDVTTLPPTVPEKVVQPAESLARIWIKVGSASLLVILAVALYFLRDKLQLPWIKETVVHTLTTFVPQLGRKPLAYLHIEFPQSAAVLSPIPLREGDMVTLGRDPQVAEILLYDQQARSTVSGKHCTIQHDRNQFWITDNNSANGTYVNSAEIQSTVPQVLQHKDEIVLGLVARQGARLRFEWIDPELRQQTNVPLYQDLLAEGEKTKYPSMHELLDQMEEENDFA